MKKLFTILTVVAISTTSSFGQISDRENDESTYLIGARPIAGNFGFYFSMSSAEIYDLVDTNWRASGIPLINMKYYWTDQLVIKAGVQIWKKRRSLEGKIDSFNYYNPSYNEYVAEYKHVETEAHWGLSLGAEKHWDVSNIIDGYIGVQGNLGYARQVQTHNESFYGTPNQPIGDERWDEGSSFGMTYGMETVIGSNFFIADMPLAFGTEFGFIARNYGANKFKYEWTETIDGISNSGTYYTSLVDDFESAQTNGLSQNGVEFTELKVRRFDIMPVIRVSFTYYLR